MPINSFLYPGPTNSNPYVVDNSCRFNDDDSACLNRSNGSSPSSQRIFTFSAWVKRGNLGSNNQTFMCIQDTGDGDPRVRCAFRDDDKLYFDVSASDGSGDFDVRTTRVFRDVGAWYHFVFRIDTTQSTAADRVKMYVNGSQITSFSTATYGSQNYDLPTNLDEINIGTVDNNSRTNFFDGYLAEVVYCDGQSLAPSSFGEFDEDSPTVWKPKDVSGLTFGTNGFYLDFEDSSNLGNDANGGTDFTESNLAATDQATDTPTNNFATLNPLTVRGGAATGLTEGNTAFDTTADSSVYTTISMTSGQKSYFEVKKIREVGSVGTTQIGIDYIYDKNGALNSAPTAYKRLTTDLSASDNDIIGVAIDSSAGTIDWYVNGSVVSGQQTTGLSTTSDYHIVLYAAWGSINRASLDCNFGGCPPFSISSGNSDANGYGNFEYAVPSGYYAICTKNLAEFG